MKKFFLARHILYSIFKMNTTTDNPEIKYYKVMIAGDPKAGKTSLRRRIAENKFEDIYKTTAGIDFETKSIKIDERTIGLQLWDMAGQTFKSFIRMNARDASVVVIVFDPTTDPEGHKIDDWKGALSDIKPGVPIIIVASKCDRLTSEEVKRLLTVRKRYQDIQGFFITSSKDGTNVNELVTAVARIAVGEKAITKRGAFPDSQDKSCNCIIL